MVSHPELADRSQRAPSVSSRTTRSKHHRGRSHHGGSSYQPQNEFPFFAQTGDVEIVISVEGHEKRYLLHRLILAQCSGFFEAGTSDEWSRSHAIQQIQNSASRPEQALTRIGEDEDGVPATPIISPETLSRGPPNKRKWRYELDWEHTEEDDDPILVQKVGPSNSHFFRSLTVTDIESKLWQHIRLRLRTYPTTTAPKTPTCTLRRLLSLHTRRPIHRKPPHLPSSRHLPLHPPNSRLRQPLPHLLQLLALPPPDRHRNRLLGIQIPPLPRRHV